MFFIVRIIQPKALKSILRNKFVVQLDLPITLTKTFTMSWLSSSICKIGRKILTLLIGLWVRLVTPAS